jgi:UDP-glucose 4-epimerase
MKVLITGGAGFIGSHLVERLLFEGHTVIVIDNLETGRQDNLELSNKELIFYKIDILDSIVGSIFECYKPQVVIHAAASYKDPSNWQRDAEVNCVGGARIAKFAKEYSNKLIYFQTSLCYGLKPLEQPIRITHPIMPSGSSYAITKTTAEQLIAMSGVNFTSFRLANCYGPRNLSGPVPTFYKKITNKQQCTIMDTRRDFIFVKDLVNAVLPAVYGWGKVNSYYHISTGKDIPIKELYENLYKLQDFSDVPPPIYKQRHPDDVETILLDPSETEADFRPWKANTPFEEGLKQAVEWYSTHEFGETYTHLKDAK